MNAATLSNMKMISSVVYLCFLTLSALATSEHEYKPKHDDKANKSSPTDCSETSSTAFTVSPIADLVTTESAPSEHTTSCYGSCAFSMDTDVLVSVPYSENASTTGMVLPTENVPSTESERLFLK